MKKSKRVFTEDEREGWMKWKNKKIKEEGNKCNLSKLLEDIPNAPSRGTILRWEHKQQTTGNVETIIENWGHPSLLTSGEMEIVAGWMLTQEFKEKVVRAIDIINFVKDSFNLDVSKQWVSEAVQRFGFTSQRTKTSKASHPISKKIPEMKQFISEVRSVISDGVELSRLVAMDEVMFWNSGSVLRSYAVRNG